MSSLFLWSHLPEENVQSDDDAFRAVAEFSDVTFDRFYDDV